MFIIILVMIIMLFFEFSFPDHHCHHYLESPHLDHPQHPVHQHEPAAGVPEELAVPVLNRLAREEPGGDEGENLLPGAHHPRHQGEQEDLAGSPTRPPSSSFTKPPLLQRNRNMNRRGLVNDHPRRQEDDQDSTCFVAIASSVPGLIPLADVIQFAGR